jgi:hypothetical protein
MKNHHPIGWWFYFGGAESQQILLAHVDHSNDLAVCSNLDEGIGYTSIRKLPPCCLLTNGPLRQIWLIGKEILHGPMKRRKAENVISDL